MPDDLLPSDSFSEIVNTHYKDPNSFNQVVNDLFAKMADGGYFGASKIPHFNGDLFNNSDTVELSETALLHLAETVNKNWRDIDPSIFGTLFERALDASKRAQLGAHYTAAADILRVIKPVILKPLRREWQDAKRAAESLLAREKRVAALARLEAFRRRLATLRVLDPACGSGNFLYLALRALLDLEKEVIDFAAHTAGMARIHSTRNPPSNPTSSSASSSIPTPPRSPAPPSGSAISSGTRPTASPIPIPPSSPPWIPSNSATPSSPPTPPANPANPNGPPLNSSSAIHRF